MSRRSRVWTASGFPHSTAKRRSCRRIGYESNRPTRTRRKCFRDMASAFGGTGETPGRQSDRRVRRGAGGGGAGVGEIRVEEGDDARVILVTRDRDRLVVLG